MPGPCDCLNPSTAGDACGECHGCLRAAICVAAGRAHAHGALTDDWLLAIVVQVTDGPPEV